MPETSHRESDSCPLLCFGPYKFTTSPGVTQIYRDCNRWPLKLVKWVAYISITIQGALEKQRGGEKLQFFEPLNNQIDLKWIKIDLEIDQNLTQNRPEIDTKWTKKDKKKTQN